EQVDTDETGDEEVDVPAARLGDRLLGGGRRGRGTRAQESAIGGGLRGHTLAARGGEKELRGTRPPGPRDEHQGGLSGGRPRAGRRLVVNRDAQPLVCG